MKKALGVILIIFFIPIYVFLVLYFAFDNTIVNSKNISNILTKNQTYQTVTSQVMPNYLNNLFANSTSNNSVYQNEYMQIIKDKISSGIKPEWLKSQTESLLKNFVDYLKSSNKNSNLNIDLTPIASLFTVQSIGNMMSSTENLQKLYNSMPVCQNNLPAENCRPSDLGFDAFSANYKESQNQIPTDTNQNILLIPEKLNVYEMLNKNTPGYINPLDTIKNSYKYSQNIFITVLIVAILIIVLIFLIFLRDRKRMLKFIGIALIIPSAIIFISSLIGYLGSKSVLSINLNQILSSFKLTINPKESLDLVVNISNDIFKEIFLRNIIISLIFIVLSIILLILSKKYNSHSHSKI